MSSCHRPTKVGVSLKKIKGSSPYRKAHHPPRSLRANNTNRYQPIGGSKSKVSRSPEAVIQGIFLGTHGYDKSQPRDHRVQLEYHPKKHLHKAKKMGEQVIEERQSI